MHARRLLITGIGQKVPENPTNSIRVEQNSLFNKASVA
jgi:hypothetical protein